MFFAMRMSDKRELDAYRATGLTPEQIAERMHSPFPTTDEYAPLPLSEAEDLYPEFDMKRHSGLLEGDDAPPIVDDPWADK